MARIHTASTFQKYKALSLVMGLLLFLSLTAFAADAPPPVEENKKRLTNFEWDAMPGAKSYELEIKSKKADAKVYNFSVTVPVWNGELKPGKYTMRLRSKDHRGVPGEWSGAEEFMVKLQAMKLLEPQNNFELKSKDNEKEDVEFKWEASPYASKYEISIFDEANTLINSEMVNSASFTYSLPVAKKYSWKVIGFDEFNEKGQPSDKNFEFTVIGKELDLPKITQPSSTYVRRLSWENPAKTEKFEVLLQRKDPSTKKWKLVEKLETADNKLEFTNKYKGGQYQLKVTATGTLRLKSKTHAMIFPVAFGDRSEMAEKKAVTRQGIERTQSWYVIASYLITQIHYSAINIDQGSGPTTDAFGGTGRIGLGYFDEETPMGFLGIVDFSGFIIGTKNYTYPSLEAHGILRYVAGDLGEARISGGLYYKEIPEILANARDETDFTVSQLGAFGVHTGAEYWYSLTSRLGLQVNSRIYYPISGKTPNGQKIIPTTSMQFGFLGSYRINKKVTGLVGYAYRKDVINYKAANTELISDQYNSNMSSVVGSYLNFFLEWNL